MHHDLPLITTIAAGLGLALVLGFVAALVRGGGARATAAPPGDEAAT